MIWAKRSWLAASLSWALVASLSSHAAAPVLVEVHVDFQCPFSRRHFATLKRLDAKYGTRIQIELKDFPLAFHPQARLLAKAHLCADEPSALTDYTKFLFETGARSTATVDLLARTFAELGGTEASFRTCLEDEATESKLESRIQQSVGAGIQSTPTTFVNGTMIVGAVPFETLAQAIDSAL